VSPETPSPEPASDIEVRDDRAGHRFVVEHADADGEMEEAELVYAEQPGRLVLIHTGVPDSLAHHGIGGLLVRAAIERADREALTVVPWCPFARKWLREHPDEAATVDIDWRDQPRQ
jgi:predicted GNAT family acetyltransferase